MNKSSSKISEDEEERFLISTNDLEYTYREVQLDNEASKHFVFALSGWKLSDFYWFRNISTDYLTGL